MESVYKLGAVITLSDLASSGLQDLGNHWNQLKETMKGAELEIKKIDGYFQESKKWGVYAGVAAGFSAMSFSLIKARSETALLESNIKSLGVSAIEVDKISAATSGLAANMGISKNEFLTGVYDIKSGISSLDANTLPGFAQSVATTAAATKGNFAELSKLFAMTYNQYKSMYKDMSDNDFGKMVGNTISVAVQKYRTDGASMNQAMNSLGSTAASLGITLTEQTAVLGTLQNVMNPGEAGTAYRAFLSKVGTGLTKLGISANDAEGKLKSMPVIMQDLNAKFGDSIDAEKEMPKLIEAFGEEGAKTVLNLMPHINALDSDIKEMGTSVKNMDFSAMDKMAKENLNNTAGQWKRVTAGIHAFGDTITKITDGPLSGMLGGVANILEGLIKLGNDSDAFRYIASGIIIALPPLVALVSATMSYVYFMRGYVAIKALAASANANYTGSVVLNTFALLYRATASSVATVKEWGLIAATKVSTTMEAINRQGRYLGIQAAFTGAAAENAMGITRVWLTAKTGLLTAASWALNSAMYANPVGLIIIGVVALIGAVAAVIYYFDTWSGWVKQVWNDHKFLIGAVLTLMGPIGWMIGGIAILADNWSKVSGAIETAVSWMKRFAGASESEIKNDQLNSKLKSNKSKLAEMEGSGLKAGDKSYDTLAGQIRADEELQKAYQGNIGMAKEKNDTLKKLDEDRAKAIKAQSGAVKGSDEYKDYQKRIDSLNANKSVLELGGMDALKKYTETGSKSPLAPLSERGEVNVEVISSVKGKQGVASIMEQNIGTDWVNGMQAPANVETPQQMMKSMNAEQVVQKITSDPSTGSARVVTNNNSIMGSMNNTGGGGFSGGANITLNLQSLVQNLQIDKFNEAELEKVFGPLLAKALMKEVAKHGIVEAA